MNVPLTIESSIEENEWDNNEEADAEVDVRDAKVVDKRETVPENVGDKAIRGCSVVVNVIEERTLSLPFRKMVALSASEKREALEEHTEESAPG